MNQEVKDKFIFTDSFRTKDILWEAYTGFIDNYHDFNMLYRTGTFNPVVLAAMNKYANYFYNEIEDFVDDFKIKGAKEIKELFDKEDIPLEKYKNIRKFFSKFMHKSGIKNIVKEKDNPGKAIRGNR